MLHYAPQHISSSTLLIIRRTNFITTASGIVTLCKQPYGMQMEQGLRAPPAYCTAACREWRYQGLWWYNWSSWWWGACCSKYVEERSVTYILLKNKKLCIKLVFWKAFLIVRRPLILCAVTLSKKNFSLYSGLYRMKQCVFCVLLILVH